MVQMLQKITIISLFLFVLGCSKERQIDNYPYVIPPFVEEEYPKVFDIFKKKT
ncbi:MAG: hypothetical protein ISQ32_05435 [Rickettsiales bacterium]|nr:hypothetical protein [Rickettsiales bacterium]